MIYQWNNTPQLCLSFTADSTQSPTVVTLMQLFHSPALLARNSVLVVSSERAIFVWPWKMLPVSVICFISWWMKRSKHGLFVFPPKKTLIWRRHCSIGQSHTRPCYMGVRIRSLNRRPVNWVGRASVWWAGVREFKPGPDHQPGSLKNWWRVLDTCISIPIPFAYLLIFCFLLRTPELELSSIFF